MVRIERLKPHPRNARKHSDEQIDIIAGLIRQYGWTRPVLIDSERNIIAGHGAVRAAQKLGMTHVSAVMLSGLTPEQARAYMLADNQSAELSTWDDEILKTEFVELGALNVDLPALGFPQADLDALLAPPEKKKRGRLKMDVTIECPHCHKTFSRNVNDDKRKP